VLDQTYVVIRTLRQRVPRRSSPVLDAFTAKLLMIKEIPSKDFADHALVVLDALFRKAKSQDEFEYACALLRI
jgi:hypothetical protein